MRHICGGPSGRHVDEDLLCVPGEERRQIGIQREADVGVLFFLFGIVVWAASYTISSYTAISILLTFISSHFVIVFN